MTTINSIEVYSTLLPMKRTLVTAGGVVGDAARGAPHLYVKISDETGCYGWGEARPSPRWSYETPESVVTTIRAYLAPALLGLEAGDLGTVHRQMDRAIAGGVSRGQPIAKAAIDIALHDLLGKRRQQTVSELFFSQATGVINLSYLIAASEPEKAAQEVIYARAHGYLGLDIKIGKGLASDMDLLTAVKQEAGHLFVRADANQGYGLDEAVRMGRFMDRLGIDVFEQPMIASDLLAHAALRRKVDVPIALDESVWTVQECVQAIRLEACDAVVIKATKMGGLQLAHLCGKIARSAGLRLLGGGLTESRLGLFASAHLFHSLDIEWPVDLNGPLFLEDDPVQIAGQIEDGQVVLARDYGTGCDVAIDKLTTWER